MVADEIGPGKGLSEFVSVLSSYLHRAGGTGFREPLRALEVCLGSLSLEAGDSVILSPLSPGYYLTALRRLSLVPILVDVDEDSACVPYSAVEKAMAESPKAVLLHYPAGMVPEVESICELGIPVVEDISTTLGGHTGELKCGSIGKYTLLTLEDDGIITAAGGSVILAKSNRDLGELRKVAGEYPRSSLLADMNSAFGTAQMKQLEKLLDKRREIARHFDRALLKGRHKPLVQPGEAEGAYYTFPVQLRSGLKDVQRYARKNGIETVPAFAESVIAQFQPEGFPCPNARNLLLRCLLFPLYPTLGSRNVERIVTVLSTLP